MKEKFLRTVRKNGNSLAINIPIEVANLLKVRKGDIVIVYIEKVRRK